ncbi:MAG: TIM barrel protein [Caldilineaceae bacterium]
MATEITWIGENGFDFVDLCMEAPGAALEKNRLARRGSAIARGWLKGVVCQAAAYLPTDSPSPLVRQAAMDELRRALDAAQMVGAALCTTHFHGWPAYLSEHEGYEYITQLYQVLLKHGAERGITVALENSPRNLHQLKYFRQIFHRLPELKLAYNIGHSNVSTNATGQTREYLFSFADRLAHVRLSDNDGSAPQQLPPGAASAAALTRRTSCARCAALAMTAPSRCKLAVTDAGCWPARRGCASCGNRWRKGQQWAHAKTQSRKDFLGVLASLRETNAFCEYENRRNGAMIDLLIYGKIIIDDILLADGTVERGVLGGGGPQAAFGARLWHDSIGFLSRSGVDIGPQHVQSLEALDIDLRGWTRFADIPTPYNQLISYDKEGYFATGDRSHMVMALDRAAWDRLLAQVLSLPATYQTPKAIHLITEFADEPMVETACRLRKQGALFSLEPIIDFKHWSNRS